MLGVRITTWLIEAAPGDPVAPGAEWTDLQPDLDALPGGPQLLKLLHGLMAFGLLGCAAAVLVGGATWFVSNQHGNFNGAMGGRRAVLAGVIGSVVIGACSAIVRFFFTVGSQVQG